MTSGYSGTVFTLRNGTRITAWAIQKSNLAIWTDTETRADDLVDAVRAALPKE